MVRKTTSVLACLLPTRFGFGSAHRPDLQEKHAELVDDGLADDDLLRFARATPPMPRSRANTAPSHLLSPLLTTNGDIGESPSPALRCVSPPARQKRSSLTTFFAFSSKKKPHGPVIHLQRDLLSPQSVQGKWVSGAAQTQVHLINRSAIPSPLRTDEEEYYYSYYSPKHATPRPDATQLKSRQDLIGNSDLESHLPSPVDTQLSHAHQHPYAYSTPLSSRPQSKTTPSLRRATSQTFRLPLDPPSDVSPTLVYSRATSSHVGRVTSQSQPHPKLKTSISTPNLVVSAAPIRAKSLTKKRPSTRSKGQERWLSAETWWDALLSPSPRFKVRQAPRPHTATGGGSHPENRLVEGKKALGVTFPSLPAARPRAASATTNVRPTVPTLTRSRSATDLGRSSTSGPHASFEPALETLVDEPVLTPDAASSKDTELSVEPPLSLAQVIDEGQAFEEQRAQWKRQATQSIGNKRTRSFSRARSKSLSERHDRNHGTSDGGKVHFNLEMLAARSLLGSQSTMPTVHGVKPSNASTHSKAYSHSHSHQSQIHSSHSRAYTHSHSHSLTTSNSTKSSNPRGHSRSGSWSRTALLKAGALCGIGQDESCSVPADEKVPPSSRVDLQGVIHISAHGASDGAQGSPSPDVLTDEVGIAISSSPPLEVPPPSTPGHSPRRGQGGHETRRSSRPSHRSSEYAGPHPSAIDTNLPQLASASTVSLRHRLPPHATIYPPISPIAHPYRTASAHPEQIHDKARNASLKVTDGNVGAEPGVERTVHPHISLSHPNFEQYGVGEALVYASLPRSGRTSEIRPANTDRDPLPSEGLEEPEDQSYETIVFRREESDTASMAIAVTPPSLTNSTIQMVMSAFNNPDDLDEFQDLFYRPLPTLAGDSDGHGPGLTVGVELPMDVRSSASSSPLTHLVRKLSEEVHRRGSRTPSDPVRRGQDPSSESVAGGIVFVGLARSASPPPMAMSSSQLQGEQRVTVPEDVGSSYTASVLEQENDTFGFPVKHGQLEAVTAPSPTRSSVRLSTHPSIAEAMAEPEPEPDTGDEMNAPAYNYLSPAPRRAGLPTPDALRSSGVTTSDVSRVSMSRLYDFPLPPSTRPGEEPVHTSVLRSYFDATVSEAESEVESQSRSDSQNGVGDSEEEQELSGDVGKTVYALRADRVTSYDSRRTFGENEDMELMTRLRRAES